MPQSPPKKLIEIQEWMSQAVITGNASDQEKFITASDTLTPAERLEIYTEDFWPRCLESLTEDFPTLYETLGEKSFNALMTQYIHAYPSHSFTLFHLGQNVVKFLEETHHETILETAKYDWAHCNAYFAAQHPPIKLNAITPETTLILQPHVTILPTQVIFRQDSAIHEETISPIFSKFLSQFQIPTTLSDAITKLSETLTQQETQEFIKNIGQWIENCATYDWFC